MQWWSIISNTFLRDPGKPRFMWSIGVTARLGNNYLLIAVADQCLCLLFSPIAMTKCQRRSSLREWLVWLTVRRVHIIPAGKLQQPELEAACSYLGKSGSRRRWMMASPTPSLFIWSRWDGAVPFSMCLPNRDNAFQKHIFKVSVSLRVASKLTCRPGWLWTPSPPVSASHMLYCARLSFTVALTHGGNAVVPQQHAAALLW